VHRSLEAKQYLVKANTQVGYKPLSCLYMCIHTYIPVDINIDREREMDLDR